MKEVKVIFKKEKRKWNLEKIVMQLYVIVIVISSTHFLFFNPEQNFEKETLAFPRAC